MNLQALFYELFKYIWDLKSSNFATVSYSELREKVVTMIESIKMKGQDFEQNKLNSALFAVCAWIDELVQNAPWEGVRQWQERLLQAQYFNTTAAGEEFFTHLSKIPINEDDLLRIYYRCLVLGFTGVYHKPIDKPDLLKYRSFALDQLSQHTDMSQYPAEFIAFPLAYKNDKLEPIPPNTTQKQSWLWWLLPIPVIVLIYFFFYFVINSTVTNYLQLIKG